MRKNMFFRLFSKRRRRSPSTVCCAVLSLCLCVYVLFHVFVSMLSLSTEEKPTSLALWGRLSMFNPGLNSTELHPHSDNEQRQQPSTGFSLQSVFANILEAFRRLFRWKQSQPDSADLNKNQFPYVFRPPDVCANSSEVFLLVYVHSATANWKRRMVIRQTWGDVSQYDVTVRVIFVMGVERDVSLQQSVQFEADAYGDILQTNFTDSYRNLTFKAISALSWVTTFCDRSTFVLKTDDDIFVNLFLLLRHLRRQLRLCDASRCRGLLMCLVWVNMLAMRTGKWKVEEAEWKESTYPRYCSGSAFTMSGDVATSLFRASSEVPFLWVDDVYVTGLLPQKAGGIKYLDFGVYYLLDGTQLEEKFTGSQWYKYIFSHVPNSLTNIMRVWRKVVAITKGELLPKISFQTPQSKN